MSISCIKATYRVLAVCCWVRSHICRWRLQRHQHTVPPSEQTPGSCRSPCWEHSLWSPWNWWGKRCRIIGHVTLVANTGTPFPLCQVTVIHLKTNHSIYALSWDKLQRLDSMAAYQGPALLIQYDAVASLLTHSDTAIGLSAHNSIRLSTRFTPQHTGRELRSGVKCIVVTIVTGSLWLVRRYRWGQVNLKTISTIPSH